MANNVSIRGIGVVVVCACDHYKKKGYDSRLNTDDIRDCVLEVKDFVDENAVIPIKDSMRMIYNKGIDNEGLIRVLKKYKEDSRGEGVDRTFAVVSEMIDSLESIIGEVS